MKKCRRFLSTVLAVMLAMNLTIPAMAADDMEDISISPPENGITMDAGFRVSTEPSVSGDKNEPTAEPILVPVVIDEGQLNNVDEAIPTPVIVAGEDGKEIKGATPSLTFSTGYDSNFGVSPQEDPQPVDWVENTLNFYINLAGDVLDTQNGSGHYPTNQFTSKLTDTYNVDGDKLQKAVKCSSNYIFINNYYDGIAGNSETDYKDIDKEIRNTLSEYITMPTDSEILASAKKQIENGTNIHDINGAKISSTLVNTSYFNVYWYVLKEGSDEWHVDGILEKKDPPEINTYMMKYEWTIEDGGPGLPSNYTAPATVEYAENDPVKIDKTYYNGQEVSVSGGKYVFSGWDLTEDFTITNNTEAHGTWEWIADQPILKYTVTINYLHMVNAEVLHDAEVLEYTKGTAYDVTSYEYANLTKDGKNYVLDNVSGDDSTGTIDGNILINCYYFLDENVEPLEFKLTMKYQDESGNTLKNDSVSGLMAAGSPWAFSNAPTTLIVNDTTYDFIHYNTDELSGDNLDSDKTAIAIYKIHEEPKEDPKPDPKPGSGPSHDDPDPAYVTITGEKYLDNQIPTDKYQFVLKDSDGKILQIAENDGSKFSFKRMSFEKKGTYTYTVSEIIGSDDTIKYDDTIYTITIDVTKRGDYKAEVKISANNSSVNSIVFNNKTVAIPVIPVDPTPTDPDPVIPTEPSKPEYDRVPKTGDSTNLAALFSMMIGAFSMIFIINRKKEDKTENTNI